MGKELIIQNGEVVDELLELKDMMNEDCLDCVLLKSFHYTRLHLQDKKKEKGFRDL